MSVQVKGSGTIGGIDQGLNTVGVITATAFHGDGSNISGIDKISEGNTEVETVDTGGTGTIIFKTEGTEKIRITQDGVLRITSGAGNTALTGTGNNFGGYIYRDTGSGRIYFDALTTGTYTAGLVLRGYENGTYTHAFTHISGVTNIGSGGNSSRITVATNGKIGINNTNPTHPLHILNTSSTFNSASLIKGDTSTSGGGAYATFTNTADSKSAYFGVDGNGLFNLDAGAALVGTNGAEPIIFATNGNTERMRVTSTGNVRFSTDTGVDNGIKIYQNAVESQIYVPHFPELLTTGSPNPTGNAAGRMPYSTISGNTVTIPANTYEVCMAGRKFFLPALSSTTLSHNATLVFDLNTMSYPNEISGMAESTVERIALYFNANSSGDSTINRIVPLCNKMTLMASKRGYIGCTNASTGTYVYSSSGSSSMPLASGDLWQTPGMMNASSGSDYIRYIYNSNGYSVVDIKAYLFWGRSPRAVTSNQNEGYIETGARDAFNAGCSAQQWVMQASQNWASGGAGTCLDLAVQVNAFA